MAEKPSGQVIVMEGDKEIARVPLSGGRMVFGRTEQADIQLPAGTVSRAHAELFADPFGRWWIRDMGSRNGTIVNGAKVDEHLLADKDVIQIEHFVVHLQLTGPVGQRPRASTSGTGGVTITDLDAGKVTRFEDMASPKIDAGHLSMLTEFSGQLLATEEPAERLGLLCRLMVNKHFRGNSALAIRINRSAPEQDPQMLCEPVSGRNWRAGEKPYISRTMLRTVLASKSPVVASNTGTPGGKANIVEMSLAASVMEMAAVMCPIGGDETTLDALYVSLPAEYGTGEWLALAALASEQFQQANVAWDARHRAEQQAVFEKDLAQAAKIQSGLIPLDATAPGLELGIGFIPCRWVGGDYVDVVEMPDGRVFLTICDVCGKGMQAALVTACLHSLVHMNATSELPLAKIIARMNDYLVENLPDESFATAIGMIYDPGTGEIESCNAGHPPAMIVDAAGKVRQLESALNPPLGYVPIEFETARHTLAPGEMLALFTDGYTELNNAQKEMLGIEGVEVCLAKAYDGAAAAPIAEMRDRFEKQLQAFQDGAPALDDLTFMIARRANK